MHADVLDIEEDPPARGEPGVDEILDDLLLTVDGDHPAARKIGKVDAVAAPGEAQLDTSMNEPLSAHPFAGAAFVEQVDRALLEHAGANPMLDVFPATAFE